MANDHKYYLSVVIPAYNEEKKISRDIEAVYEYFKESSIKGELILVDDGSQDKTYEVASKYSSIFPSLKIISYKKNKGKGFATKTGILAAYGEYILLADSGICVPYKFTNSGLEELKQGADIAIGSRKGHDKVKILIKQPFYRQLGSKLFHFLIKIFKLIPPGIEDTQCGFKLFKLEAGHKIFQEMFTEKFMWDIEMLRRAVKKDYKVVSFPVDWSNDPDSRFNPIVGSFENLLQIILVILKT